MSVQAVPLRRRSRCAVVPLRRQAVPLRRRCVVPRCAGPAAPLRKPVSDNGPNPTSRPTFCRLIKVVVKDEVRGTKRDGLGNEAGRPELTPFRYVEKGTEQTGTIAENSGAVEAL